MINLIKGFPALELLPTSVLEKSTMEASKKLAQSQSFAGENLNYVSNLGNPFLRKTLASKFSTKYYETSSDYFCMTHGATGAFSLITTLNLKEKDTIVVEDPTYFVAPPIFKDYNFNLISVPLEKDGMNLIKLEEKLKENNVKLVYTIPVYHNPTGTIMSIEKRKKLIELSQKYNFKIMADEVYQHLYFDEQEPPPPDLCTFDNCKTGGTVYSVGSFSKTICPGMRLGWIQVNPKSNLIQKFIDSGTLFSGGGLNSYTSLIIDTAIELNLYNDHLKMLKVEYSDRLTTLCNALKEFDKKKLLDFEKPKGGYFLWIKLNDQINFDLFSKNLKKNQVQVLIGNKNSIEENSFPNFIRLCFAYVDRKDLIEGSKRICISANESLN
eukprot:gene8918-867_t